MDASLSASLEDSSLVDEQSEYLNENQPEEEECIVFFPDDAVEVTSNNKSSIDEVKKSGASTLTSSPSSRPQSPFAPGDHVYQWCKVAGVPAFHHHAIIMQVYWDTFDEMWMLHVSDFSNISLYDASAMARRRTNGSSTSFGSGSNPFLRKEEPGCWRSYATPAARWHKVIYEASLWQQFTNPSAGTCTRVVCDPPFMVQARAQFLQLNSATLLANKPYHWLYNNCEAAAVWCKTGKWCTLQALSVLTTATAGQVNTTAVLAGTAAATQVTVSVPSAGIWGSWFGMTTSVQVPLLVSQPYWIPVLAAYGLITVGVPALMIHQAKRQWSIISMSLNDLFWSHYALERPEVFVEFIQHFYIQSQAVEETGKGSNRLSDKEAPNSVKAVKIDRTRPSTGRKRRNSKSEFFRSCKGGVSLAVTLLISLQMCWFVQSTSLTRLSSDRSFLPRSESVFGVTTKIPRGGDVSVKNEVSYQLLAKVVEDKFSEGSYVGEDTEIPVSLTKLAKTLSKLSSAQQTFKTLDGVAHEAYQRTHTTDDIGDTSVSGRAQRSASRLASVAEALLACELVEAVQNPTLLGNDTLGGKHVILNVTSQEQTSYDNVVSNTTITLAGRKMPILVLFEPAYNVGAGLDHGTLLSLTSAQAPRDGRPAIGRLLIILGDPFSGDSVESLRILDETPLMIKLSSGLVTNEVASVQPTLYQTAGQLLTLLEPHLRHYNMSAIHFVGHSLAGGVASLAATMLDGSIGMPKLQSKKARKKKKRSKRSSTVAVLASNDDLALPKERSSMNITQNAEDEVILEPLSGLGRARSSALSLGSPPCLSSNVIAAFCTSFIYGDDIVSRTTQESINKLLNRMEQSLYGGFVSKNLGWMTDTFSLAVASLQNHAHGSEGEELKLSIPGRAYLVRPRRLANICSIHEVGNLKKGGREALREALLWQMHDILLSKSMWKHHSLESYIQGLDRVQLRGVLEEELERLE
jgi:hypothetical protein